MEVNTAVVSVDRLGKIVQTVTIDVAEFRITFRRWGSHFRVVSKATFATDRLYDSSKLWIPPNLFNAASVKAAGIFFPSTEENALPAKTAIAEKRPIRQLTLFPA